MQKIVIGVKGHTRRTKSGKRVPVRYYHKFVVGGAAGSLKSKILKKSPEWYSDTEDAWIENGVDSKVWRTFYDGFEIMVYPCKVLDKNVKGWEYHLSHPQKTKGAPWDSWYETYTHGKHPTLAEVKQWAINTVDEWE